MGPSGARQVVRLEFSANGEIVTNNQAEYRTLIAALAEVSALAGDGVADATVDVYGDSKLVIEQLAGRWKIKNADLRILHGEATNLIKKLGKVNLHWHRRDKSVEVLGH